MEQNNKKYTFYLVFKRIWDILFSLIVLLIFLPIWIIISIIVAVDTKTAPLYVQERVGKNEKVFNICKFRTMVKDSDNVEKYLQGENLETWKREHKVDEDPRITKFGRLLRKVSIDEVPNFINVFLGQMSVVGPRPITRDELPSYGDDTKKLLSVKPGVTGWWQVQGRTDADFESGNRQKLELYYVDNLTFKTDLKVFFKTFAIMFSGNGK